MRNSGRDQSEIRKFSGYGENGTVAPARVVQSCSVATRRDNRVARTLCGVDSRRSRCIMVEDGRTPGTSVRCCARPAAAGIADVLCRHSSPRFEGMVRATGWLPPMGANFLLRNTGRWTGAQSGPSIRGRVVATSKRAPRPLFDAD